MSNIKAQNPFKIELTGDSSPTLLWEQCEPMHSRQGALAETLYIYSPAVEWALQQPEVPHILSIGLGLGYNEFLTSALILKNNKKISSLVSMESQPLLTEYFLNFVHNQKKTPLDKTYSTILNLISCHFQFSPQTLLSFIKMKYSEKSFQIQGALEEGYSSNLPYHGILFDAYSLKSSPHLWTEVFLDNFIKQNCDKTCVFATYAATGNLKRTLKKHNFFIRNKNGFGQKREATFATRKI